MTLEPPPPPRTRSVALIGNPNTGKTTVFNRLTGFHARTGNYPGVTVDRVSGSLKGMSGVELIDLPGTYSLAARSPDEMIAVDVLLGRKKGIDRPDAVVVVVDAANLERNLYLVTQAMELGLPTIVCLNMVDVAEARALRIDADRLVGRLGIPVVPCVANRGYGLDALREVLRQALANPAPPKPPCRFPEELHRAEQQLREDLATVNLPDMPLVECRRTLLDFGGEAERRLVAIGGPQVETLIQRCRDLVLPDETEQLAYLEAEVRYRYIDRLASEVLQRPPRPPTTASDRLDRLLTHRLFGTAIFMVVMGAMFVCIFQWAAPLIDLVDGAFGALSGQVASWTWLGEGALKNLLAHGIVAGVGAVLVFLPQILVLFAFIAVLEDCGYMARAAFLMDRLLRCCGLSGRSFIPMLSAFACAVPGIMAARTIESRRDRLLTILVAPLMSCSARIPIYTLLIAAFIPSRSILGFLNLQGLVFASMYFVGILVAIPVAFLLKKTILSGRERPFLLELPPYKAPSPRIVFGRVVERGAGFVRNAGTLILAASIVVWALSYWPAGSGAPDASTRLQQSYIGSLGRVIEPVVAPVGWDWKVGVAILASFPAREVVISALGVIYRVGDDMNEVALRGKLRSAQWEGGPRAGLPVFTLGSALALMVFYALCCQCAPTLMVMWRETRSWKWPALAFSYMTALAYLAALATSHLVRTLGGA
ncbi:MAG: ferrous iron transport protein B [Planctomycetes bacterium]|nr:ferrous iron transport protein B [Planctomycetota bacterium]